MAGAVPSPGSAGPFFAGLLDAFERATAAVPAETVCVGVAERSVELEFAGPELRGRVVEALNILELPDPSPDLTVKIFDSVTTGVVPPPPAWTAYDYRAQGEIAGFNTDRYRTAYRVDTGCLSMIDLAESVAVFWIRDAAVYPAWMRAAPLRTLLGWWAGREGLQMVHGAAVGAVDAGALLTAPGGAGKSTSALRCLLAGMRYAGDDYVMVDPAARRIYSVFTTAKADDAAIDAFFPQLRNESSGVIDGETSKHIFYLDRLFPDRLGDLPLSAIAVPSLTDGPSRFAPMAPAQALRALAPTTLFQLAGSGSVEFEQMARLVRSQPVFALEVSTSAEIAGTLRDLLRDVGSVAA